MITNEPINHRHFSIAIVISGHSCHFSLREMESCANRSYTGITAHTMYNCIEYWNAWRNLTGSSTRCYKVE